MKVPQLGIALLLCLFLFNCSKDENPTPESDAQETGNPNPDETPDPDETQEPEMEVYFEAVISDFYPTDNADNWLLTHDKEGKILDYISFEKNDTIRFEIPRTSDLDEFTVTDIRFSTLTSSSPYFINSHTEVVKGSSWIFAPPSSPNQGGPRPESTGNFRISVSGIPQALSMFHVSNESANGNGNGAYFPSITPGEGWRYEKRAELFEDNDYYITLVNGLGDTRYYYLEGAQQSQEYDLGYDEFSEFG
ncbi:hypothetical protein [Ulvibacterium sp.]|uniref:hypothetical protein n=1 Tax=Ulvibacterium sp. TaxID=2665914 RepID=UPI003CC66829